MAGKGRICARIIALGMAIVVSLTGCGEKSDMFTEYKVSVPVDVQSTNSNLYYVQEYLSHDVCVIPTGRKPDKDSFMTAGAALLVNKTTNEVLYSQNVYKRMYPASVTKIVTTLMALKYGNMDDDVTISYNASHITEYGAKLCGFQEGDVINLKELLYSFMVCSGNDAGIAIAEHISGSVEGFAKLMNREMAKLGAAGSHFVNPHGLHDDNHYTTAYDLYLVFNELTKYDMFYDIIGQKYYTANFKGSDGGKKTLSFGSTNRYKLGTAVAPENVEVIGGKTGTTMMAGSNLIIISKSKDMDYISIVMHASDAYSLYDQMNYLLNKI